MGQFQDRMLSTETQNKKRDNILVLNFTCLGGYVIPDMNLGKVGQAQH